jgi:phosphotransferase system HPr (HPr) family protein
MKEISFTIKNPVWMQPGTAVSFTLVMEDFTSGITVSRGGGSCDGKDFYGLMKLRNLKGEVTKIKADGPDEEAAIYAVKEFIGNIRELS